MSYEEKTHGKYKKVPMIVAVLIMVIAFLTGYFGMGYYLDSAKDLHTISELNAIKSYVERNPDCEKLIKTVKQDSPHLNIKLEIDNEEKITTLTIFKSEEASYNLCINYDEQMNIVSSTVHGGVENSYRVFLQVLYGIIPVLIIAVVSFLHHLNKKIKCKTS